MSPYANFETICGDTPPAWPSRILKSPLDGVSHIDIIKFTMIRRSPKPDPKLRALQERAAPPIRRRTPFKTQLLSTAISSMRTI